MPTSIPPLHFTEVINADHNYLIKLTQDIREPGIPGPVFIALLTELSWRLVRHDVSEELVMRPAFKQYMGEEGQSMANMDRTDHFKIRKQLLSLRREVQMSTEVDPERALEKLLPVFSEMAEHMQEENTRQLRKFAELVDENEELRLGGDYALSFALTPNVGEVLVSRDTGSTGENSAMGFESVEDYLTAENDVFRSLWATLGSRSNRMSEQVIDCVLAELDLLSRESTLRLNGYANKIKL